jgi:hypothetical protein
MYFLLDVYFIFSSEVHAVSSHPPSIHYTFSEAIFSHTVFEGGSNKWLGKIA